MAKVNQKWLEDKVWGLLHKWQPLLNLHVHDIHLKVSYQPQGDYAAHINWEYPYKWAMLHVNSWAPEKEHFEDANLEKVIVHELTHLLLLPIDNIIEPEFNVTHNSGGQLAHRLNGAVEETVEGITAVLLKLYKEDNAST